MAKMAVVGRAHFAEMARGDVTMRAGGGRIWSGGSNGRVATIRGSGD